MAPPIILVIEMVKNLASCLPNVIKSPFLCMVSGMCLAYIEKRGKSNHLGVYTDFEMTVLILKDENAISLINEREKLYHII